MSKVGGLYDLLAEDAQQEEELRSNWSLATASAAKERLSLRLRGRLLFISIILHKTASIIIMRFASTTVVK